MREIQTNVGRRNLNNLPHECPHCHRSITPNPLFGYFNEAVSEFEVFMYCPDVNCKESFIAKYYAYHDPLEHTGEVSLGTMLEKNFPEVISNLSTSFTTIYNQAYLAEQQNLLEICGVGYRKSLEFLIKDYAILNFPDDKESVEKKTLSLCINDYVEDTKIKTVATRAVWLGNDETHYVRKWEGKNLADLKKLIDLTVHWIEMEELTLSFEEDMP